MKQASLMASVQNHLLQHISQCMKFAEAGVFLPVNSQDWNTKCSLPNSNTFMKPKYLFLENTRCVMLGTREGWYKVYTIQFLGRSVIIRTVYIWGISSHLQDLSQRTMMIKHRAYFSSCNTEINQISVCRPKGQ